VTKLINISDNPRKRLLFLLIPLVLIAADQYTKMLVVQADLSWIRPITVIDNLLYITHIENPGSAFGMFSTISDPFRTLFLASLATIAIALVVFYSLHNSIRQIPLQISLHLIFAGAIGNLIDRAVKGTVTDFVLFKVDSWSFPAFNLADSAIVVGVFLLLIDMLFFGGKKEEKKDPAADALGAAADLELNGPRQNEFSDAPAENKGGSDPE